MREAACHCGGNHRGLLDQGCHGNYLKLLLCGGTTLFAAMLGILIRARQAVPGTPRSPVHKMLLRTACPCNWAGIVLTFTQATKRKIDMEGGGGGGWGG